MVEGDGEDSIIDAVSNSDELAIFETDSIRDMVDYKWKTYARKQHLFGGFIHLIYIFTLIAYIWQTFLVL